jgi:hypothetical protein
MKTSSMRISMAFVVFALEREYKLVQGQQICPTTLEKLVFSHKVAECGVQGLEIGGRGLPSPLLLYL